MLTDIFQRGNLQKIEKEIEMKISGHTIPFAVLGHPIGHTLSPVMHNAAFEKMGIDAIYLAFDVHPNDLISVLHAMGKMKFRGVNLTVPLKEIAFNGIQDLDTSARVLGAVNTVSYLPDGRMIGYNTDGYGFLTALKESFGIEVNGLKVFIYGCGGAGRAVALTCAIEKAEEIILTDIVVEKCIRVSDEIKKLNPFVKVVVCETNDKNVEKLSYFADLIVQCTPCGMKKDDKSPLDVSAFRKGTYVYDLVYIYPETDFMKKARSAGALAANGLGMLLHQGAKALSIWLGCDVPLDVMRRALENEVYGKILRKNNG